MRTDIDENQQEFARIAAESFDKLEPFLAELLAVPQGQLRCYTTTVGNPSQQLKNKLSQAAPAVNGLLVLGLVDRDAYDKAREALFERWGRNANWLKSVSCVALSYPEKGKGHRIGSIVTWRPSQFPDRIRELLFPDVHVVEARRWDEATNVDTHGDPAELAELLCVDEEIVRDWLWLIEDRRALIFYGPPGTSKTFIARKLAEHLQPRDDLRRLVQLHPSFGYEEFFEGYRPVASDVGSPGDAQHGGLRLTKVDGPLRDLVRAAERAPDEKAVMILDEVNRGNLPRVFGELFFLIEYRDAEVSLMYSPREPFRLPKNVIFIGTMNTADRSVAVLDQALRRRFHFVPLFPGEPPVHQMLARFLARHRPEMAHAARLLDLANEQLPRHFRIGPSHLMRSDLNEEVLEKVWRYSVLPSIAEQFFDREEELNNLSLDALRATLAQREGSE